MLPLIIIVILIATIYCLLCVGGNRGHLTHWAMASDFPHGTGGWAFLTACLADEKIQPQRQSCPGKVIWPTGTVKGRVLACNKL